MPAAAAAAASLSLGPQGTSSYSKKRATGEDASLSPRPRSGVRGVALDGSRAGAVPTQTCAVKDADADGDADCIADGDADAASPGPSPEPSPAVAGSKVSTTLGSMCKRGVLVRETRKMSCLSAVGVRFVKAATWCKNCGLVSNNCFDTHTHMFHFFF